MKVHYKQKMTDKVIDAISKANIENREVDFIELTDAEMMQFKRELSTMPSVKCPRRVRPSVNEVEFMGVTVVKESPLRGYGVREDF